MTHISKQKLEKDDYVQLFEQLAKRLGALNQKNAPDFLTAFLTETEQIMLIKRYAAILLLHNKYSAYRISEILHMSPSTTDRMQLTYEAGHYAAITTQLDAKKRQQKQFWELLETISRGGMPPMDHRRWRSLSGGKSYD